jgi:hypothetical protein
LVNTTARMTLFHPTESPSLLYKFFKSFRRLFLQEAVAFPPPFFVLSLPLYKFCATDPANEAKVASRAVMKSATYVFSLRLILPTPTVSTIRFLCQMQQLLCIHNKIAVTLAAIRIGYTRNLDSIMEDPRRFKNHLNALCNCTNASLDKDCLGFWEQSR